MTTDLSKILYRIAHERQTSNREEVNNWKNTNIESRNLRTWIVLLNNGLFMASSFSKFDKAWPFVHLCL